MIESTMIKRKNFISIVILIVRLRLMMIVTLGLFINPALAGSRFISSYSCSDTDKICIDSGTKMIDGFAVTKDCWQWSYSKECNYPSKDNCRDYYDYYHVSNLPCLLRDSLGNCVNLQKEFSVKRWIPATVENQKVRMGLIEKDGQEGLVCKGIPCIDGNCIDKSYMTNGEMIDSISKLYAVGQIKTGNGANVKLFEGISMHCSKKAIGYSNCCSISHSGWGKNFGAECTKDEQLLIDKRRKKLCVYVGKVGNQKLGVTTTVKHYYCCFAQMLDKVMRVEGKKQLGINFGSGGNTNCRGLTLDEILRIDFNNVDFTEFIEEFKIKFFGKYKSPNNEDMSMRVKAGLANIRQYDGNSNNQLNNQSGWSSKITDNSWQAEEELQVEVAAAKQAEQKRQQESKTLTRQAKEQELNELRRKLNSGHSSCQNCPTKDQLLRKIKTLEQDLISGNFSDD